MAQSLKSKIRKLTYQYNVEAIIDTAHEVRADIKDEEDWIVMSNEEQLQWFYDQCKHYGLTTKQRSNHISVVELPEVGNHGGPKAYFTVFLPSSMHEDGDWEHGIHLEIGSAYANSKAGQIWPRHPGKRGKEKQIAEVMRLHMIGK